VAASYFLGIDVGTTYTAAAVWRDGRADLANLGTRAPVVPTIVLLAEDGELVVGEPAEFRAPGRPGRVAREFKRRVGDPTPVLLGTAGYSPEALMGVVLAWVVARVAEAEAGPAAGIAASHPANWGDHKQSLLRLALAEIGAPATTLLSEPEAAAIHYATQERVEPGAIVAVYDLGGGTFDAAMLQRHEDDWEILGQPQGVERLGGVDFDEAVFEHVLAAVAEDVDQLDPHAKPTLIAVARLRQDCVAAKEALGSATDVAIPVMLPNRQTEVRLTRAEFESAIRPALARTVAALRRALRSADLTPSDVGKVLLVGGSSRIPLVAEVVGSELGRPVAVDAHPKHGVALGAAIVAASSGRGGPKVAVGGGVPVAADRPRQGGPPPGTRVARACPGSTACGTGPSASPSRWSRAAGRARRA
jgi:molecular chaperone DnaK